MPGLRIHPTPPPLALIHACTLGDQMEVTRLLVEEGVDVVEERNGEPKRVTCRRVVQGRGTRP